MKHPIYPCLWFDGNAKEAADFYCAVFNDSEITAENPIVVTFKSAGQKFMCLNGGPQFKFNPSISFYVVCESEAEIEHAWSNLLAGGSVLMPLDKYDWSERYGWLADRFGLNWQLSLGKPEDFGQKFTPVFMFTGDQNGNAEQAIRFYTSVFDNSSVEGILKYQKGENELDDAIKHAQFRLDNYLFMAMDSSFPHGFGFNEAISFVVDCDNQEEIDHYWDSLSAVPEAEQCGWLKDRYGISWQIVPAILGQLMSDPGKSEKVVQAFLKMKKFEIDKLINI